MEAIRKKKIKRTGKQLIIDLPEDFKAEEVDVIVWRSQDEELQPAENSKSLESWKLDLKKYYSNFNVDLSNFKFNRDELYDR
jgi:hypothetical protein